MPDRFQTVTLPPLTQGMITMLSPSSLNDRACRRLLNMEYTLDDMPETRKGMTCWCEHSAASHPFDKRISSLTFFRNGSTPAAGVFIVTVGRKIYRSNSSINNKLYTDITGNCEIEDDVEWTWRSFYDRYSYATTPPTKFDKRILVGVPQQDTMNDGTMGMGTNIVYWDGVGNIKRQTFNGYNAFTFEEMNRRFFYVCNRDVIGSPPTTERRRNKLSWTKLGAAFFLSGTGETSASGAGFVYLQKDILGLGRTRERLFIFHRDAIEQLKFGEPETDQNQFRIEMVTDQGGCVNAQTITPVLDDIYFLSDYGWVSINAVQKFGDFEQALISDKILDLRTSPRMGVGGIELDCHRAVNYYEKNQVWLSIPSSEQPEAERRYNQKCFVMHYRPDVFGVSETERKFTTFNGRAAFSAATVATYQNRRRLFIAKETDMPVVSGLAAVIQTGGSMPNGTYYFKLTAVDQYGAETLLSDEISIQVVTAPTDDRIHLTWTAHPHAANIRVYKGNSSNGQNLYQSVSGTATSYNWDTDSGKTPVTTLPTKNLARLHNIFLTDDKDVLEDDISKFDGVAVSETLNSVVETKDYIFQNEGIRKEADYWAALFKVITSPVTIVFGYLFDYDPNQQKTKTADLEVPENDQWDEANWDSANWAIGQTEYQKIERKFVGHPGRIFHAIRFIFKNLKGQRWGFRGISMDVAGLDERESTDA